MPPKTLLHVFPSFAVGGAQNRFAAVANHLGAEARHIVVSLDGRLDAREKLQPGLDVRFAEVGRAHGTADGVRRAFEFLRGVSADRLVTSNWGSMDWVAAAWGTRLPHIHTEDGFGPDDPQGLLRRRVLARRAALRRSHVVLPSRTLLRLASNVWRLPQRRLHYVPNGIDVRRFAQAVPVALPGEGKVVGTVAILRPEKNLARLVRAFALVRTQISARLVIVGDGPERAALEGLAAALGVAGSVHFAGQSGTPENHVAAFDVFALSSDTEQMPLSVLEAMAAGKPVAATDVGDVRDILAPENAPFVVRRDEPALAEAMLRLLAQSRLASAIGAANAARAASQFSDAGMFGRWRELLGLDE